MSIATLLLALATACGTEAAMRPVTDSVVTPAPARSAITSVTVTFDSSLVSVGSRSRAVAVATDASGADVNGRAVAWTVTEGSEVASVASDGVVTAVEAGTATVDATVDGIAGRATLVVRGRADVAVTEPELPRVLLNTPYRPARGATITVGPNGSLQEALNAANRGDEIVLTAGATYTGNFVLPAKRGGAADGWIVVRSSKLAELPPEGTRVTAAQAPLMPRIVTPNSQPAIATALRASGYRLVGIEVTVAPAWTELNYGMVTLGDGTAAQNQRELAASDLVLDRMYVHGQTTTNSTRCIALNSARTVLSDSYVVECHAKGFDSQAVIGWNGPGPFKIVNNTLSGAGENVMFGGADPFIPDLVPSDIEFRRNYLFAPAEWKGRWTRKNLFETKNAARVLVEGNVMDGNWLDGQTGFAVLLKSTNQSGHCRWCRSEDITFRLNVVRNSGGGINLAGWESEVGREVDVRMRRILIEQSTVENINVAPWNGIGRLIQIIENPSDVTIRNVTITSSGALNSFLFLGLAPAGTRVAIRSMIGSSGEYGIFADGVGEGQRALSALVEGALSDIVMIGGQSQRPPYPSGVRFAASLGAARSIAGVGADEVRLARATQGVEVR